MSEFERYAEITAGRVVDRQEYEYNSALGAKEAANLSEQMFRTSGATEYVWNVARQVKSPEALNQLTSFVVKLGQLAYDAGAWAGKRDTNFACAGLFDQLLTAAGGKKSFDVVTNANH